MDLLARIRLDPQHYRIIESMTIKIFDNGLSFAHAGQAAERDPARLLQSFADLAQQFFTTADKRIARGHVAQAAG